ncbi:MAG: hypothetical protein RL748_4389 [Pseudomonadota bacterium]
MSPDLASSPAPYIEPHDKLDAPTRDMHRGLAALIEALQAVDHYNQRYDTCTDPELRLIIAHHRDQHKAQAAMLLEWVRRRDVRFDHELKQALFKAGPITAAIKS